MVIEHVIKTHVISYSCYECRIFAQARRSYDTISTRIRHDQIIEKVRCGRRAPTIAKEEYMPARNHCFHDQVRKLLKLNRVEGINCGSDPRQVAV